MGESVYVGREQTLIKHVILRKYLERFAQIVGSYRDVLTYVDCFAGPWKAVNPNRKVVVDTRTPTELLDLIEAKGREVAEALAVLRSITSAE